ncbi:MAG: hypothetical protein MZV64_26930 [Ignavibacteriales bacterium]|nr:hypothetical protein [Ignavibacteriales bacterium]
MLNSPSEAHQPKEGAKPFTQLTTDEIEAIKTKPERLKEIAQSINGAMEFIRRTSSDKTAHNLRITVGNSVTNEEKEAFRAFLNSNNSLTTQGEAQFANILKEVTRLETLPIKNNGISQLENTLEVVNYKFAALKNLFQNTFGNF